MTSRLRNGFAACIALAVVSLAAGAQSFPSKPVRIVVPFEPGGANDLAAREIQHKLSEALGQPVIVENRAGAGGQIGAQLVARAEPDGHTIMFTVGTTLLLSKYLQKDLPFDPIRDFTPITNLAVSVTCIAAGPSFAPNSLQEMIAYARNNPGKISYGTTAIGGLTHLAMMDIERITGTSMVHVPYKGGGPIAINLLSGVIQLGTLPAASVMAQVRAGKMKILAVFETQRFKGLPNVPAVREILPEFSYLEGGIFVLGPGGMTRPVVQSLFAAIARATRDPSVAPKLEARGQMINLTAPEEFAKAVREMDGLAANVLKRAGIVPQ